MLQDFLLDIRARRAKMRADRLEQRQERRRAADFAQDRYVITEREPSALSRLINGWWDRLFASVYQGNLGGQEAIYEEHLTQRDYLFNTLGAAVWAAMLPILTMVATWLGGVESAGVLSMAFVVGNLLLFMANYGVRTFQVSDVYEESSFSDYQVSRFITCAITLVVGFLYCRVRGYDAAMMMAFMGVIGFRVVDGLADVYEGRLQQMDKLYLSGISQLLRCGLGIVAFAIAMIITKQLGIACLVLAVAGVASLVLLTVPMALMETPKSDPMRMRNVQTILSDGFPLFVALFLYAVIDSMPKFAMEGVLSYDNQLYFNLMYFPAHAILTATGIIYKPQLLRLANAWDSPSERSRFDKIILAMIGVIIGITVVMAIVMATAGIPLTGLMYGIDFEPYRIQALAMIGTGGLCAAIEFLYQVVTVLRCQQEVMKFYLGVFLLSIPVSILLVRILGIAGAVIANVVIMAVLFGLMVWEYVHIRQRAARAEQDGADDMDYFEAE